MHTFFKDDITLPFVLVSAIGLLGAGGFVLHLCYKLRARVVLRRARVIALIAGSFLVWIFAAAIEHLLVFGDLSVTPAVVFSSLVVAAAFSVVICACFLGIISQKPERSRYASYLRKLFSHRSGDPL